MKKSFLLIILTFILLDSLAYSVYPVDTIDYWHVFYNNKIVMRYPYYPKKPPIKIKISNIKESDILKVQYGDDTPCGDCATSLYIFDNKNRKITLANSTGYNLLKVSIRRILNYANSYNKKFIDFYYRDSRRDHILFRVIFE